MTVHETATYGHESYTEQVSDSSTSSCSLHLWSRFRDRDYKLRSEGVCADLGQPTYVCMYVCIWMHADGLTWSAADTKMRPVGIEGVGVCMYVCAWTRWWKKLYSRMHGCGSTWIQSFLYVSVCACICMHNCVPVRYAVCIHYKGMNALTYFCMYCASNP